jgi:hypothetical protein
MSEDVRNAAESRGEWDVVAMYDRAHDGLIPYYVWIRLSLAQQARLGRLSQTQARREVAELTPTAAPDQSRTTTAKLADAAQAALRQSSRK